MEILAQSPATALGLSPRLPLFVNQESAGARWTVPVLLLTSSWTHRNNGCPSFTAKKKAALFRAAFFFHNRNTS